MSSFKRRISREAQKLRDEIEAVEVTPEEEATAKAIAEELRAVLQRAMKGGHYDSSLACAALADAAAWLGEEMCLEKEREAPGPPESRAEWLVFYTGAVGEALKHYRQRERARKEGN